MSHSNDKFIGKSTHNKNLLTVRSVISIRLLQLDKLFVHAAYSQEHNNERTRPHKTSV